MQTIQTLAKRAGELAMLDRRELILAHPENTYGTVSGAQWRHQTKADLIEAILSFEYADYSLTLTPKD